MFSLVVGGAMVSAGVGRLSTFSIPETILGIVGLSQAVYIGGKLVTPTTMKALNDALDDLRDREKKLRVAVLTANNGAPVANFAQGVQLAGQAYAEYRQKAADVRALFLLETNVAVENADLEPKFSI